MEKKTFQNEDDLVQLYQDGEITLVEFIDMHSPEWQEEYLQFCIKRDVEMTEYSALDFLEKKNQELEDAIENHDA